MADEADALNCSPDIAALVPASVAREEGIFPLGCSWSHVTVAVGAPLTVEVLDKVQFLLGREVRQLIYPAAAVREAILRHYGGAEPDEDGDLDVCWCWPTCRHVAADGTLDIKASGWQGNTHWTGWREVKPDDPDYAFWRWLIDNDDYDRLVEDRELPEIRRRWARLIDLPGPDHPGPPPNP